MTPLELAAKLHIPINFLYLLTNQAPEFYRVYRIPKKNGKSRTIEAPMPILKRIQSTILDEFLALQPAAPIATAFEPGSSIRKNAQIHCGKPLILELDLKDFFPSLKYAAVLKLFQDLGHPPEIAVPLAKLCTLYGHLPQGAVSSPRLSNLLMCDFDAALTGFCCERGIAVTRYADDLTFSGELSPEAIAELICYCRGELRKHNLRLNNSKIRVLRHGSRQEVTGLVVNEKVSASRTMRRALRQEMYYLNRYWETEWSNLSSHALNVLLGRINFVWDQDRENPEFSEYRRQLLEIKRFSPPETNQPEKRHATICSLG